MKLQLRRYNGQQYTDYTDWVETVKISQHAEGLVQSQIPDVSMNIRLSIVLDSTIKPASYFYWCINDNKQVVMVVQKISRMKHSTELWLSAPTNTFLNFIKGLVTPSQNWRTLFSTYNLEVEDSLIDYAQKYHVSSQDELLLGMSHTAKQKTMIEHKLPRPWSKAYDGGQYHTIRQVQTAAEFDIEPKPNVAKYKIAHEDVIEEQDFNSRVDPTSIITSRLNQKKAGKSFTYVSATNWSNHLDELILHECPTANTFGVSHRNANDYTTSRLYMSDGAIFNAPGLVIGVTPELCYVYKEIDWPDGSVSAIRYDGTIVQTADLRMGQPLTNKVLQDFSSANKTIQIRQNLDQSIPAADVVLLGTTLYAGEDPEVLLGIVRYTDPTGVSRMKRIFDPEGEPDSWLMRADLAADGKSVIAVYGRKGAVSRYRISYNGTVLEYGTYDASSNSNVYPISVQQDTTSIDGPIVVTGYLSASTPLVFGRTSGSALRFPPISWAPISGDTAFMAWFLDYSNVIARNISQFNGFDWRPSAQLAPFATSRLTVPTTFWSCLIGQVSSVLIYGNGTSGESRTVVMEASPMPENTYDLYPVETRTGSQGEGGKLLLPFLLQGGSPAWALVPTDKTRLKVDVSALSVFHKGSGIATVLPGVVSKAYVTMMNADFTNTVQPKKSHIYYMFVEVKAPQGIIAEKASFAWNSEESYNVEPFARISLEDTSPTTAWVRRSLYIQVPSDFSSYVPGTIGVLSKNAQSSWMFRHPFLIDLTEAFGAQNEPGAQWCDENIDFSDSRNIIQQADMDVNSSTYLWDMTNAEFTEEVLEDKLPIDNDDIVLPQIGCPILYQRTEDQGVVDNHVVVDCVEGWEDLYVPFHAVQGLTYTIKFDWKVNSTYQPLNQDFPGIMFQVLNAAPASDGNVSIEVTRINLPTQEGLTSQELTFTAPATGTYYFDFNFGGAADEQVADVNVQNIQVLAYGDDILSDALKSLVNWKQALPQFTITSTGGLEEGVILGFDYEFSGATSLWIDILLLGQPKPWSDSYLTN